ncbi:acetyltransferase [Salinivibrio costicola]|uniref:Acetyltransferase n=1 Tax=Salinivibrio costicola TaxID=51367 RepID=A0ABX6K8D6_SALCS|nr:acetyltransferase [Salinivibrio costicola]QIR06495.1 acetyltransferase [Salinivibrio costicola]
MTKTGSKCAVLGARGHGKVVAEIAELNGFSDIHFFDDRWPTISNVEHWNIHGNSEMLLAHATEYQTIIVAIGNNSTRLEKHQALIAHGAVSTPLVHPKAIVSHYAVLEPGTVVMAGAVVNPFSHIGQACIVNTAATIDHDCDIAQGVHISPGAHLAGGVQVASEAWIGAGATIKPLVKIGAKAVIGAGATVLRDVESDQTQVGIPAKPLVKKEI